MPAWKGAMRSEQEVYGAMERYADTVRRICALCLKNTSDTEDIFQEVFLKYALRSAPFGSVRPEFEPHFLKIPESSGTLRLTEFCPSPGTGQKPALTLYLTTVGKLHNRV